MLFTAKTLSTLEYDKIIRMLVECASTDGAKARAASLSPTDDYDVILSRQRRTDDAKRLINTKGYPAFSAQERVVSEDSDFVMLTRVCTELSMNKDYINPEASGHYNNKGMEIIGTEAGKALAAI